MNYQYLRVSTTSQINERQEIALKATGIKFDKTFEDKCTGKNTERPELNKLRLVAKDGDNIYVESISRLGRNVDDLRALTDEFRGNGVIIHFLKEGINTKGDGYKFLITILGAVAEMERENIQERTIQRIDQLKEKKEKGIVDTKTGNWFGRPEMNKETLPKDFGKYYKKWKAKEVTATEFAKLLEVGRTTLYRYIKIYEEC